MVMMQIYGYEHQSSREMGSDQRMELAAVGEPTDHRRPVTQRAWAHTELEAVKCGQVQPVRLFEKVVK
jgi:hypothetical protein